MSKEGETYPEMKSNEANMARIQEATARILQIVKEKGIYNRKSTLQARRKLILQQTERFGQDSIVHILPYRAVNFTRIMNSLHRNGIFTKDDLATVNLEKISQAQNVGDVQMDLITAMRELARAELGIKD